MHPKARMKSNQDKRRARAKTMFACLSHWTQGSVDLRKEQQSREEQRRAESQENLGDEEGASGIRGTTKPRHGQETGDESHEDADNRHCIEQIPGVVTDVPGGAGNGAIQQSADTRGTFAERRPSPFLSKVRTPLEIARSTRASSEDQSPQTSNRDELSPACKKPSRCTCSRIPPQYYSSTCVPRRQCGPSLSPDIRWCFWTMWPP